MNILDLPKLSKYEFPTKEELEVMTPEQKRLLLMQLKQEDTMYWQKEAAQIQVWVFRIGFFVFLIWGIWNLISK